MNPSQAARILGRARWIGISKEERSRLANRGGARPKVYALCPLTGSRHRFKARVCKCGQQQLTIYRRAK
jgi:hypothetical protein